MAESGAWMPGYQSLKDVADTDFRFVLTWLLHLPCQTVKYQAGPCIKGIPQIFGILELQKSADG